MRMKTYEAATLQEAFKMMRDETEAAGFRSSVISTRTVVKGGMLGVFSRPVVQVTVAIEDPEQPAAAPRPAPSASPAPQAERRRASPRRSAARRPRAPERRRTPAMPHRIEIRKEDQPHAALTRFLADSRPAAGVPADSLSRMSAFLAKREVENEIVQDLVRGVTRKLEGRDDCGPDTVTQLLEEQIRRLINVSGPITTTEKHLKIVAFVGPTGVGKTTTIAKLAADFAFTRKKKVGLITLDTYRIAAVEQLKSYARIMNIPITVAHTPEELKIAVNAFSDKDIVMIDTAGRSFKDTMYLRELKVLLNVIEPVETHLVLSAGTRYSDICAIMEKYGSLSIDHLVLTKLDEVSSYGTIVNLKDRVTIPISYITNGQNVPKDIAVADAAALARLVVEH